MTWHNYKNRVPILTNILLLHDWWHKLNYNKQGKPEYPGLWMQNNLDMWGGKGGRGLALFAILYRSFGWDVLLSKSQDQAPYYVHPFLTLGYDFNLGKSALYTWEEIMFYKCLISKNWMTVRPCACWHAPFLINTKFSLIFLKSLFIEIVFRLLLWGAQHS